MAQKHVNATNQFDRMLDTILKEDKSIVLGNVTFSYLGPNKCCYSLPMHKWDNAAITKDLTREAFARKFVWLKDPEEMQPDNIFTSKS